ncbi:MAG: hypothetical protein NUW37_14935 [Planctomycetes bacterium]|nr:hypothetical protein [Planctomycetota bacterium]
MGKLKDIGKWLTPGRIFILSAALAIVISGYAVSGWMLGMDHASDAGRIERGVSSDMNAGHLPDLPKSPSFATAGPAVVVPAIPVFATVDPPKVSFTPRARPEAIQNSQTTQNTNPETGTQQGPPDNGTTIVPPISSVPEVQVIRPQILPPRNARAEIRANGSIRVSWERDPIYNTQVLDFTYEVVRIVDGQETNQWALRPPGTVGYDIDSAASSFVDESPLEPGRSYTWLVRIVIVENPPPNSRYEFNLSQVTARGINPKRVASQFARTNEIYIDAEPEIVFQMPWVSAINARGMPKKRAQLVLVKKFIFKDEEGNEFRIVIQHVFTAQQDEPIGEVINTSALPLMNITRTQRDRLALLSPTLDFSSSWILTDVVDEPKPQGQMGNNTYIKIANRTTNEERQIDKYEKRNMVVSEGNGMVISIRNEYLIHQYVFIDGSQNYQYQIEEGGYTSFPINTPGMHTLRFCDGPNVEDFPSAQMQINVEENHQYEIVITKLRDF